MSLSNPFAARFREAAFTLEDTNIPEIAEMLHIASREIERLEAMLGKCEEERRRLLAFAMGIFEGFPPDLGSYDGGDIQILGVDCGLLIAVEVTEPCCENCACASVDFFPLTCYRRSALIADTV